jgi:hypothetical protein
VGDLRSDDQVADVVFTLSKANFPSGVTVKVVRIVFLSAIVAGTPCLASVAVAVRTVPVPTKSEPVAARIDSRGAIHLLFNSKAGPQYATSVDNGESFSKPIPVVNEKALSSGLEFTAWDMAIGREGRVHVALGSNAWKLKRPKEDWGLYYARLDPGAKTFSPLQNINHQSSEGFSLAADDAGNVTACWLSGKLYANISHNSGKTFGPNVEIDPLIDPCDCCTTSATYAKDGKLAVLYREETNDQRDIFLALWEQNRNVTKRIAISTTLWKISGCPMTYFKISRAPRGFVAVWPTKGQIYFARLGEDGNLLPPGEIKTSATTGMRTGVLALSDAIGNTLIVSKAHHKLSWQLYDVRGSATDVSGSTESASNGVAGMVDRRGVFVLFP